MPAKKQTPKAQPKQDDMMTSTDKTSDSDMLQLGGLWVNESKSGTKYMTGYLGNLRIMIFRNNYKTEDKHPDYVMYLAEQQRQQTNETENTDDIPF